MNKINNIFTKKWQILFAASLVANIAFLLQCNIFTFDSTEKPDTVYICKQIFCNNDSISYYKDIIDSDLRLKQHFVAVKYQDSILTAETAINFMFEAGLNEIEINYLL